MKTSDSAEKVIKDIKRATRRRFSPKDKIRIVLEDLRGEDSIAAICRRESIHPNQYYKWSKDFMEAGKRRLQGDTVREANSNEVTEMRQEMMGIEEPLSDNIPTEYNLGNPCPNPFNPVVNIPYELPEITEVEINIYNIAGKKVQTLVDRNQSSGRYNINFNASHLASGVYIVRISTPNYTEARKMLLLK